MSTKKAAISGLFYNPILSVAKLSVHNPNRVSAVATIIIAFARRPFTYFYLPIVKKSFVKLYKYYQTKPKITTKFNIFFTSFS